MDKFNIVFLIKRSNALGGTERVASDFLKYLDKDMFDPTIIFSRPIEKNRNFDGIRAFHMPQEDIPQFLIDQKINVVIIFSFDHLKKETILEMKKTCPITQIVNFSGKYDPDYKANLITTKFDRFKIKLMQGKELVNDYVLYHPIDVDKWVTLNRKNPLVKKDGRITIGRIGRAEPSKWHYYVLATLKEFKKRKMFNEYRFVFAGIPRLYQWYLKLFFSKQLKNEDIILFPELSSDAHVSQFYQSLDLFFQTAWIGESFGCVIAEAFAHKCPVMTDTKFSIIDKGRGERNGNKGHFYKVDPALYDAQIELVDHNDNGFYANHPISFINELKKRSLADLEELGNEGFNKVKDKYEAKKVTRNLQNIILTDIFVVHPGNAQKIYPSQKEIKRFEKEYFWKQQVFLDQEKEIPTHKMLSYNIRSKVFRGTEWIYLYFRAVLRKRFNKEIEEEAL